MEKNRFEELKVWKKAHNLVLEIYKMTKGSLTELENQLSGRLLTGLIRSATNK